MRDSHQSRTRAFTLLELLLVIALVGMLSGFAIVNLRGTHEATRLKESAERMQTLVAMCRAEAMNETRTYRVEFRPDGSLRIERQLDPIKAPHIFQPPKAPWARTVALLDGVWVEAVQDLPDDRPPIRLYIVNEELEFPEMEYDLVRVDELEYPPLLEFTPDGTCGTLRWVLRDEQGHARMITLDGRLGRVKIEPWEQLEPESVIRPVPLEEDELIDPDDEYTIEDFE